VRTDLAVLDIGFGGLGHLGVQFGAAMGLSQVRAIEPLHAPREWAQGIGIEFVYESVEQARVDLLAEERAVSGVVDVVGSDDTASFGVEVLDFGGGIYVAVG